MSIDWDKRQGALGKHRHLAADVLDPETGEESVGGASVQAVYSRTTTLTDAQFKALPTTPTEVVPAPGAGKMIRWVTAHIDFDATAGAYTFPVGALLQLCYDQGLGNPLEASGWVSLSALSTGAVTAVSQFPPSTGASFGYDWDNTQFYFVSGWSQGTAYADKALLVGDIYAGVADYTGGSAANTVKVTVIYTVLDL